MVHGTVTFCLRTLGLGVLLVLLAVAAVGWRLHQGPVALTFLSPFLESSLNPPGSPVLVRLGETRLTWAGWDRALDLQATDVRLETPDGRTMLHAPRVALALSSRALLEGDVAVSAVELLEPEITLRRMDDGTLSMGGEAPLPVRTPVPEADPEKASEAVGDTAGSDSQAPLDIAGRLDGMIDLLARRGGGRFTDLKVTGARARLIDERHDGVLEISRLNVSLSVAGGRLVLDAGAVLDLPEADGSSRLALVARHRMGQGDMELGLTLDNVNPSHLAGLARPLAPLAALAVPLTGTVTASLDLPSLDGDAPEGTLRHLGVSLEGGQGRLDLPAPLDRGYAFRKFDLNASATEGLAEVVVDALTIDLGDAAVSATFAGRDLLGEPQMEARVRLDDLAVADLKRYWPPAAAANARSWIVQNLSGGRVPRADLTLNAAGPSLDALEVTALDGSLTVEGVTVDYRNPLPRLVNATGNVDLSLDGIGITVTGAGVEGLPEMAVEGGTVLFSHFDERIQWATIDARARGPLSGALAIINHEPLRYADALGIDPAVVDGQAETRLKFTFPLLNDLTFDEVEIEVTGSVVGAGLANVVLGQDLQAGDLSLVLDKNGMDVKGKAVVGEVPATLTWRENFAGGDFTSRYNVTATLTDADRARFGLVATPFQPPYLTGPVKAALVYTTGLKGGPRLKADLDLSGVAMAVEPLGWSKPAGAAGTGSVTGRFGAKEATVTFDVSTAGGQVAGTAILGPDADVLRSVAFDRLALGNTWVVGSMTMSGENGLTLRVADGDVDLRPVLAYRKARDTDAASAKAGSGEESDDDAVQNMRVDASLRSLRLANDTVIDGVRLDAVQQGALWGHITAEGTLRGGHPLGFTLKPQGNGQRAFSAHAGNTGALLRALDVIGTIDGGQLEMTGTVDAAGVADGVLEVENFRLRDAPVAAKVISVAGMTGIADVMGGQGIGFDKLYARFTKDGDRVVLHKAQANGTALGFTTEGQIDFASEQLNLDGAIVPAYAINKVFGAIPLLGTLITGGDGEGLFAVNYALSGPLEDPSVMINPLSVLTPGFLRRIFDIFDDSPADQTASGEPAPAQ